MRRDEGFLYVEMLMALVLLSLALLGAAPLFVRAAKENASASDLTFAMTAANDLAERLKRIPYDDLADGADELDLRRMTFDRTWQVDDDTPHAGMRTCTITVTPRRSGVRSNRIAELRFYRSR